MARENQTLQIALISSIILTVLLLITSILFFRSSQEQANRADAATLAKQNSESALTKASYKNQTLEYMIAGGNTTQAELEEDLANIPAADDESLTNLKEAYKNAMALFGEQYAETRNYQKLPEYLLITIRELNQQLSQRDAEVKKLVTEKDQIQKDATARIQQALDGLKTAQTDLENERAKFNQEVANMNQTMGQITTQLEEQKKTYDQLVATSTTTEQQLRETEQRLRNQIEAMRTRIEELGGNETFEIADGEIISVNQRAHTVWINLGSRHNLLSQMTFSVYPQGETGLMKAKPKATIEVTQIIDANTAEARIVNPEAQNTIYPGDKIHTPAWRPGRQVRFGLAGFLDVDNDGRTDRELVRSLIRTNNGIIDVEIMEDGQTTGQMSPLTRYLVLGELPAENNPNAQAAITSIIAKAQEYGVQQMSLDELLDYMGWRGAARTVPLGRKRPVEAEAVPEQQPSAAPPAALPATSAPFDFRQPPARGSNGAF